MSEESNISPQSRHEHDLQLSSSSIRHVNYCCGACGFNLNLSSCNRHTLPVIGSEYGKFVRRGIVSFFSIDESRFTLLEEVKYRPYFSTSKRSWGLLRRRTNLLCRKCGAHVGSSDKHGAAAPSEMWDGISESRIFSVKIRALQPSST
ncbi:hypothetical protein SAY87_005897 [Trapa incisa]|uniref:Uncharacterized protein n=1 Tax=Trapa incisa TaxID=236973 RepID=A0AAN7K6V7_9MYRT|nr:hypothetical protein SAY87_005897 [Trapa incisa]